MNDFFIDITHTLKVVDSLEYEDSPWDRVRRHEVVISFQDLKISTVRLIIVTDEGGTDPGNIGQWREVPKRFNSKTLSNLEATHLPVTTVTLYLSATFEYILHPLPSSYIAQRKRPLLILHNGLYSISIDRPVLETAFECSGSYVLIREHEVADQYFHDFEYVFRAFSLNNTPRSVGTSLPRWIIRRIAALAINHSNSEEETVVFQARVLLSCALIGKEWFSSGLLDLLWSSQVWKSDLLFLPQFLSLADCLVDFSSTARQVITFPRHVVFYGDSDWKSTDWLEPVDMILRAAYNLEEIDLRCFEFNYSHKQLKTLEHVENFRISPYHRTHVTSRSEWDGPIDLEQLLGTIQRWPSLKVLRIHEWNADTLRSELEGDVFPSYHLRELGLELGRLAPSVLKHLLSKPDQFTRLSLSSITGLSNDDLQNIFTLIQGTLSYMSITNCTIMPPSKGRERAFDAVVGNMRRLTYAGIQRDLVSTVGIMRKQMTSSKTLDWITIYEWRSACEGGPEALEAAVEITGWQRIVLLFESNQGTDTREYDAVRKVATGRGIDMLLRIR